MTIGVCLKTGQAEMDRVELNRLAQSDDVLERRAAVEWINQNIETYPEKEQARADLDSLMHDKESIVRRNAIGSTGSVYSYIPQKVIIWNDLLEFVEEKARELLQKKGEYEDDAIRLVSKVLPIIEERVKAMVSNIQRLEAL